MNNFKNYWDDKKYPTLVYVETTNVCNAHCKACVYDRMERKKEIMSLEDFKFIANKVKAHGLMIGAMFCFGEPLSDPTLFEKYEYAKEIGVITPYNGLNTNVSLLTEDKYDKILKSTNNITLSFFNTGEEYERLTGLNWEDSYAKAIAFIRYRDKVRPNFNIQIGVNDVEGASQENVRKAFAGFNVAWARDAEIKWGGKVITGVIDRSIMYHDWKCDGHKGAMQIKPNGDCCICAYDVIKSESKFANILTDDWETIEKNFKENWKNVNPICKRCDYWNNYHQMVEAGWKRGAHIDETWQEEFK